MAWKTGYYYGSGFGGAGVPYSQYTHVLYESISPNGGGGIDTSPANLSELDGFVSAAHAAGTKALVCLGVADAGAWQGSTNSGNIDSFVAAVHSFVTAHNLDGVDLDWESGVIDAQYASFIQKLRASFGSGLTITMAAYGGGTGNPKHSAVLAGPSNLDQINMMTYDMDIYEGQTWFETAVLKGPDSRTSIQTSFEEFTSSGIPASKLGIGIPFYGSRYNSASGPNQGRSYGGFIAYANINPSGAVVDSTYQGTGVGSNPWITFVGAAEIADIVAYGSSVGAGGYMTFPINWEDSSNTLSAALNTAVGGGSTPSPLLPTIYSFAPDTTTVVSGGAVIFTYATANATSLSINGTTVTGTSHTFNPAIATDYVLIATNADGSVTSSTVHIAIGSGAPTVFSFTATPSNFVIGQSVTLSWVQSLGTSASINNSVGSVTGLSSKVVNPIATTTYTLTVANGTAPDATAIATVTLGGAPPVINSFTASDSSIAPGDPVTLSFAVSGAGPGAGSITLNGVPVTGTSVVVAPLAGTRYLLVVTNGTSSVSQSITIDVIGPSPNNLRIWQVRDGDKHGTLDYFQISDGTGEENHFAKYLIDGSVTNSTLRESDLSGLIASTGTALTTQGQNSWYGQVPRGAINGSNTNFLLDYTLANPYPILHLNGVAQLLSIQGDPSSLTATMATPGGEFAVSVRNLTVSNAPRSGEKFYVYYFRKDPIASVVSATINTWSSFTSPVDGLPHGFADATYRIGASATNVYRRNVLFTLTHDSHLLSSPPAAISAFTGSYIQFQIDGTLFANADNLINIYDCYITLILSDASVYEIRPVSWAFTSGSDSTGHMGSWAATTGYGSGTLLIDANGNVQICSVAGTSGTVQPIWATSGATIDGGVTWTYQGDGTTQSSTTGQIANPGLAFDADSVPPTTFAAFKRIHYSGLSDGGLFTLFF